MPEKKPKSGVGVGSVALETEAQALAEQRLEKAEMRADRAEDRADSAQERVDGAERRAAVAERRSEEFEATAAAERAARKALENDYAAGVALRDGQLQHYYFSVQSPLTALRVKRSEALGPRGTRVHVSYGFDSKVETQNHLYRGYWLRDVPEDIGQSQPLSNERKRYWNENTWNGIQGRVLSGADFLLARLDGVLELDGRVTIRALDETLIDATYWGLVDLEQDWVDEDRDHPQAQANPVARRRPGAAGEAVVSPAYRRFVDGEISGKLNVQLCVRFETNTGPWAASAEAEDSTWTKPSRLKHEENVWKYVDLVRHQFYAFGTMDFVATPGAVTSPTAIEIDVFSLASRRAHR